MESQSTVPQGITFQPNIYARVLKMMPESKGIRVLDLGAGQGYFSGQLKKNGFDVWATDFLEENFFEKDVPFAKSDLNKKLPYPDNYFDYVVSIEVIEHLENQFEYAKEIMRITKPNGRVIITTPNVLSISSRWAQFWYGFSDCAPFPINPERSDYFMEHISPVSLPEMMFQFAKCGAKVNNVTTNRIRKGAIIPFVILYPFFWISLKRRLFGRHAKKRVASAEATTELHNEYFKWMIRPATLLGRITIIEFIKKINN